MSPFTPIMSALPSTVPFVGPEAMERRTNSKILARIGANENVFGPSPKAIEAMQAAAHDSWQYGDPENHDLKQAIAQHLNVDPKCIACGEGIDGLLGLVARLFVEPGDTVATSLGAYPTFNFHIAGVGGRLVTTPYVDDHESPTGLLQLAKTENAKLIYFANPDNPMGTCWSADVVQDLIDQTPDHAMLLLDEAYVEFAGDGIAPAIDTSKRNLLRFRTFSKAYGLAGIRVGYAIGHQDIISGFEKIRNHFGISRISQAGAIAAIEDQGWVAEVKAKVAVARQHITEIATANGLKVIVSATNFVAVDCGRDGVYARRIVEGLQSQGIFIRMPAVAPLNRCIRISAGTIEDLQRLGRFLPEVLARAD